MASASVITAVDDTAGARRIAAMAALRSWRSTSIVGSNHAAGLPVQIAVSDMQSALGCRMLPLLAAAGLTLAIADGPARSMPTRRSGSPTSPSTCVHKEYPGKIAHVLNGDQDVLPPRTLTPAFFGCYDWHSSVHGHWLLARLDADLPERAVRAPRARRAGAQPDAGAHRR